MPACPSVLSTLLFFISPFPPHTTPIFDGHRLEGHCNHLEGKIFGKWEWDPGHIAGVKEAKASRLLHRRSYGHLDMYLRGKDQSCEQTMWL